MLKIIRIDKKLEAMHTRNTHEIPSESREKLGIREFYYKGNIFPDYDVTPTINYDFELEYTVKYCSCEGGKYWKSFKTLEELTDFVNNDYHAKLLAHLNKITTIIED